MSQPIPRESHPNRPLLWEGLAAMVGGLLWLVAYAASVPLGRENGSARADASASWLAWSYFAAFAGATLSLGAGLAGLQVRRWRRKTSLVGLLLAVIAFGSSLANTVLLTGLLGRPRFDPLHGGNGAMATCVSAVLLGVATWRERTIPRGASIALLATGSLTVVLIFASTLSFGPVPAYFVDDLPFALAGAAWIALGAMMRVHGWRG